MKNKEAIQTKLERVQAKVKKIGYHIRRNELEEGYNMVERILNDTADIQTLLNRETQD